MISRDREQKVDIMADSQPDNKEIHVSVPLEKACGSPSIRDLAPDRGLNTEGRQVSFKIPTNQDAAIHVNKKHGQHSWQAKILKVIHTKWFQRLMIGLLLLDVLILFTELFLMSLFPSCSIIVRDAYSCCLAHDGSAAAEHARWLASDSHSDICEPPSEIGKYEAGCDPHKYNAVHMTEKVLFSFTIAILSFMMLELLCLMAGKLVCLFCDVVSFCHTLVFPDSLTVLPSFIYNVAISPCVFFRHVWYILDFFIVAVSLTLEALFKSASEEQLATYTGLLVLFRCWRFVRISHGLIEVTSEFTAERYEKVIKQAIELENLMEQHEAKLAAEGVEDSLDSESLREIHDLTKSLATQLLATKDEDSDVIHYSKMGKKIAEKIHHSMHHKSTRSSKEDENDGNEDPKSSSRSKDSDETEQAESKPESDEDNRVDIEEP